MSKPIEFELTKSFLYADGSGIEVEAVFIDLSEPTGKVSHICCEIESIIHGSIAKMSKLFSDEDLSDAKEAAQAKKDESDSDLKMDAESALAMMNSSGADMNKVVLLFRDLFPDVAMVDGKKKLTKPMMDKMTHQDMRRMVGEYIANFILL